MKPSPSAPRRFSAGTLQSLKISSDVSLARNPSLFSFLPGLKPGVPFSTMNALMPCEFFDGCPGQRHPRRRSRHPECPLVQNVFEPLMTQLLPSRFAVVRVTYSARRSHFGLGERPCANLFALRQRRQILLLLLFAAEFKDVIAAQRIVRGDDDADAAVDARKLFDRDDVLDVAEAGSAVLAREKMTPSKPTSRRAWA